MTYSEIVNAFCIIYILFYVDQQCYSWKEDLRMSTQTEKTTEEATAFVTTTVDPITTDMNYL